MLIADKRKLGFLSACIGLGMGMAGQLYIYLPSLGVLPMLDIFSYATAPILMVFLWSRMGRYMRRCILWGFAWSIAAVFANLIAGYEFRYALKSIVIVCSSWTLMTVTWWVLRKDARIYLWYLTGIAIGGVISLYHFQPGTVLAVTYQTGGRAIDYLMEKVRYPYYTRLLVYVGLLPFCIFWKKFPGVLLSIGIVGSGLYLLFNGGSRSNFGAYAVAGMVGFGVCYMKNVAIRLSKHTILLVCMAGIGAALLYGLYLHWAQSGALGEGELLKYESEEEMVAESGDGRLAIRGGFDETLNVVKSKPWGEGGTNIRHSVISNSLNCEGVIGFAFWIYFCLCVLWFVKNRLVYSGRFAAFFMLMSISQIWNMIGSPFGARHGYFALMAFIALCRDNPGYGGGTVFDDFAAGTRSPFGYV